MTNLNDDPFVIAEYLIQENGIDHAIQVAGDGTTKAQQDGDNYALSVWREVKTILRNKKAGPEGTLAIFNNRRLPTYCTHRHYRPRCALEAAPAQVIQPAPHRSG